MSSIDQAIKYIKKSWKEGKTLSEIAAVYAVDPGNLARAFRNLEGVTVKTFVDRKRKKYVNDQLGSKSPFGYQIGASLGFASDLAFYRWVKRMFGVSFKELRTKTLDKKV